MQTFGWPEALFIFRAAGWTLLLTVIAFAIGGVMGGALAIMRLSRIAPIRHFASAYILVIQSIPVLMVLFMSYYGLSIIGIELPPFFAASASLAVYVSAYLAEIWRGSIQSVPFQQWEASASLAHSPAQTYRYVILPRRCASRCRRRSGSSFNWSRTPRSSRSSASSSSPARGSSSTMRPSRPSRSSRWWR